MRPGAYGGWALIGLGVLILLFAVMDNLRPRLGYITSTPVVGATLAAAPPAIRVTFSGALHSVSTLSLVYVPVVPSVDDISHDVRVTRRLAASDTDHRTLEVIPPRLGKGLYLVRWVAHPASGGITRHGSFTFGVGVPVPPDDDSHLLLE